MNTAHQPHMISRQLKISTKQDDEPMEDRNIEHIHFLKWADFGTPNIMDNFSVDSIFSQLNLII